MAAESYIFDDLKSLISKGNGATYVEARYQSRITNEIAFSNGELERIRNAVNSGCGIRVLVDGCWGFSGTSILSKQALEESLLDAMSAAKALAYTKKNKVKGLAESRLARGLFKTKVNGDLESIDIEQKVKITKDSEEEARKYSSNIKSASCLYHEILDHKIILNTDGSEVELYDSKPEFNVIAVAREGVKSSSASEGVGVTGGWDDLFYNRDHLDYATQASHKAMKLLHAKHVIGERTNVILDPGMVGLISHEAIGHMVEADFVLSGSAVKDMMGRRVASELVNLVDSGSGIAIGRSRKGSNSSSSNNISGIQSSNTNMPNAAGTIQVDDEGVLAGRTVIVKNGILSSFLHNRETAFLFDTEPTGNARAFEYNDEPLIRMRNTFIESGKDKVDEMISETRHGYLIKGARNGQADANGEFMFGFQEIYLIEKGEVRNLMQGGSVSGNAFDVLQSVDMVGMDFDFDIGTGYCGKFQPAKVDGGGPHIRCTAIVGGLQ
jgi:TldD protein